MYDSRYKPARRRSQLRIHLGWAAYNILRSVQWFIKRKSYLSVKSRESRGGDQYPHLIVTHKTPLVRRLKDTDMAMQENKIHNLRLAVEKMDGIVLYPGQVFSYWKLIGPPMAYRGFKKGMVLVNGTVQSKTGGGLCQLSNLIYWMTLHTPLIVTERFRHSYDVFPDQNRTQPFGSGATCVYKYRDLQIKNEYMEPFKLSLALRDGYLWGGWYSAVPKELDYEVYEKRHWISQGGAGTYIRNNILFRKCFCRGQLMEDRYITENHALMMYSPLLNEPVSFSSEGSQS
jgi:vancomycin resistance protein VanW